MASRKSQSPKSDIADRPRTRDPERTRAQILSAAIHEFVQHGYSGGRIDRIVKRARCNTRMAYHYFGSKSGLYLAALEALYDDIRTNERALNLSDLKPVAAMRRLVEFTVDHFAGHPEFVRLTNTENLQKGRFIRASKRIPTISSPLIEQIRRLLLEGAKSGDFRRGVDPLQLYVTIVALSCHHLNNAHTLSATFKTDLTSPAWQRARKRHVVDFVVAYLTAPGNDD